MIFGYARVSTLEQNLDSQILKLIDAGCEKIFSEKVSGRTGKQLELEKLISLLRPGDTVLVYSVCRLGRTTKQLFELFSFFKENNIIFKSITEGLFDTSTPMGEALLQIISVLKQMEVNILRERSLLGLEIARNKGIKGGRPKGLSEESKMKAIATANLYVAGNSVSFIQKTLNISRSQVYRFLSYQKINLKTNK